MLGLRLLLIVDALALAAASTISDPIVGDVAMAPTLLVGVIVAIACLSADLVPPRRRVAVVCSALTIVAPFPLLALPQGPRLAAAAVIALQVIPIARGGRPGRLLPPGSAGVRRVLAALMITTTVLLMVVAVLTWYGATYLLEPPAGTFLRGPYLTRLTTTEADFAWQLKPGQPQVTLSALAPDGTNRIAAHGHLTGLQAGTRYEWTANIAGRSAAAGTFTTAPRSTATPINLVSFGDYGSGNDHEYAVARLAAAADPGLFLSSGDNAYLVAAPPVLTRLIFQPLRPLLGGAPMVAALGEHDLAWRDGAAVISALHLPGHHYSVQYGPVQVVVLGLQADASARAYAAKTLGRCHEQCPVRFVLVHRPLSADAPILPLLRRRHVSAILAGHLHRYERQVLSGVLEFTVGTGGEVAGSAQYTPATPGAQVSLLTYGFLLIRVTRDHVDYRFINERGQFLDHAQQRVTLSPSF
ncbi:MAG: metallophosphoesterase family protein [Gaiellales bacterium]